MLKFSLSRLVTFGSNSKVPERNIALAYLFYILAGTLLLLLPWSHTDADSGVAVIDHIFTAVSAVSTTGLATVDVPGTYSAFGMCVILCLIQLGAIGYMTVSSYLMLHLTRHMSVRNFEVIRTTLAAPSGMGLNTLVNNVIHFTFIIEAVGFVLLWITFGVLGVELPAWHAVFISISSFCTAGFSSFADSLCSFNDNVAVNVIVAVLSFAGAMGFIVITDLMRKLRDRKYKVTFTTRVIVNITLWMTVIGTVFLTVFPSSGQAANPGDRTLEAFFQTMSAMTTVGYNTFNLATLPQAPALILAVIMFVGASPSGTGGGVKCTTLSAVYAFVVSRMRGSHKTALGKNTLPDYRVNSALTNIIVYGTVLLTGVLILSMTDSFRFSDILFECASALGTVGISLGITADLSVAGKLDIIALMYIGRIGVLTLGAAVLARTIESAPRRQTDIAI